MILKINNIRKFFEVIFIGLLLVSNSYSTESDGMNIELYSEIAPLYILKQMELNECEPVKEFYSTGALSPPYVVEVLVGDLGHVFVCQNVTDKRYKMVINSKNAKYSDGSFHDWSAFSNCPEIVELGNVKPGGLVVGKELIDSSSLVGATEALENLEITADTRDSNSYMTISLQSDYVRTFICIGSNWYFQDSE